MVKQLNLFNDEAPSAGSEALVSLMDYWYLEQCSLLLNAA